MQQKKSFGQQFATWFGVGALMFGTYCGGSMASGTYATAYMTPFGGGYMLVFLAIFCVFMTFFSVISLNFIRAYQVRDFNEYSLALYGLHVPDANPLYKRIVSLFFDLFNIIRSIISTASAVALFGELLHSIFGMEKLVGCLIGVAIFTLLTVKGSEFLRKFNSFMTIALVTCLVVLLVCAMSVRGDVFLERLGNFQIGLDWTDGTLPDHFSMLISYCFLTCTWGSVLCNFTEKIETKKDAIATGLMIGLLVTSLFFMTSCVVLPFLPEMLNATPILSICQMYFKPALTVVYWVVVIFSVCTTAPTFAYNLANRYVKVWKSEKLSDKTRFFIIVVVFMLACVAMSTLGLMTLAKKGYTFLGKIGGFAFGIPLVISIYRVHKKDLAEANN